jgi:hypothetical protein
VVVRKRRSVLVAQDASSIRSGRPSRTCSRARAPEQEQLHYEGKTSEGRASTRGQARAPFSWRSHAGGAPLSSRPEATASQPERGEDQARDCNGDHAGRDRDHPSQGPFVDRPLVNRLCALLERIGSAKKSVLPLERLVTDSRSAQRVHIALRHRAKTCRRRSPLAGGEAAALERAAFALRPAGRTPRCQRDGRNPASVTATSRRTPALDGRALAAVRAWRQ